MAFFAFLFFQNKFHDSMVFTHAVYGSTACAFLSCPSRSAYLHLALLPVLSRPFLEVFPREIRDQIFTHVLATPSGLPWAPEVVRSLTILRVCKQVHREFKDIIWLHNGLALRQSSEIYDTLSEVAKARQDRMREVKINLEILDRDELEWICRGLKALKDWPKLESIIIRTSWERPQNLGQFNDVVSLRNSGVLVDGRLFQEVNGWLRMKIDTAWPTFSHWGKHKWLKRMLLDPSGIEELLKDVHGMFGGELYVDGVLVFSRNTQVAACNLDSMDGEIRIVPAR